MVLEAWNGQGGLAHCRSHEGPIDLLVSDVVMPEPVGRELAEGVLKLEPGMKVMFLSGHTTMSYSRRAFRRGPRFCNARSAGVS